ncbi:MAG: isoleucine--tRNA ligase [Candidatus Marinimicrobia bacterium]|nr:isoleucine--tRNA ligase [Candidatus Neomarinimicrobiota bacterium]
MSKKKFNNINSKINFIDLEHDVLNKWDKEDTFNQLRKKNKGNKTWSFLDGPITANNPMGVHHAWGRTLKDVFQRYHAMNGYDLRYQNGFDCQGLWVEVEVEKELGFKSKKDIIEFGIEKFVNLCKERVEKYSAIQTEQSKRLGYWMDWDNSYYTMSDENNYTIWSFLKKLFDKNKIYRGTDVVPWSGRSGTSYSQMEIIEGRKLVAHKSVFVKFPLLEKKNEYLLVWTTTPWTLTSNISAAVNIDLEYLKLKTHDGSIFYFAKENFKFQRLDKQFKDKKQWVKGVPKLKTIEQIFKERGAFEIVDTIKGKDMLGWKYSGPFDELKAQSYAGGHPFVKDDLKLKGMNAKDCHIVIDGGNDSKGSDVVVSGEGTGIVHIATGCGSIDNKIGKKNNLVEIAPLNHESKYIDGFGFLEGMLATKPETTDLILDNLKEKDVLLYVEKYPHIYPHCWRSGDELVYRSVDEWYINMDWRNEIKKNVGDINWIPDWGHDREIEWLTNMGDWMISKKRFWGLALPIWRFEDGTFYVVGSKKELKKLCVEGWDDFEGHSPHRPWIDKIKIKHPDSGLIGKRIEDVGNPWLDAGIVPFSTLNYSNDKEYWNKWFPADFVVECLPGQFRNWFYSLLAMSTTMESKAPFKTLLGHALVKDSTGRDMHKSWGNAIWFDDAAEKMGVDTMRWLYASQNPERNLLFGYEIADEVRKNLITLWNTYSFFTTYANLDDFNPNDFNFKDIELSILDRWVLAKMNKFITISKDYYENYELFKLMKEASFILDDISNWYVRRNRRRFWKSENDKDKYGAYLTLYNVLVTYIKILAPVIPFVTEKIYENLVININSKSESSIHLSDFPKVDERFNDDRLVEDVDTIKEIVSLGRSARNKCNLKIRQPLSDIKVYLNKDSFDFIKENKYQILEELNVKDVIFVKNKNDIVKYDIKPNFNLLGKKYGSDMKNIVSLLSKVNFNQFNENLDADNNYYIEGTDFVINKDEVEIKSVPVGDYSLSENNGIVASVNISLTNELINEGIVRDLIRKVQNLRKELDFEVENRISIDIKCSSEFFLALENNIDYFKNETLCININRLDSIKSSNYEEITINSEKIDLLINKTTG